jgi:hypothetical protein
MDPKERESLVRQLAILIKAIAHWRATHKGRVWYSHGPSPEVSAKFSN